VGKTGVAVAEERRPRHRGRSPLGRRAACLVGGTFHGVSPKHLQRFLDEFVYRFNRRWLEDALSGFVLRRAMQARPFPQLPSHG